MKRRCLSPKRESYKYYGGRGIKVCDEWLHSYDAFLRDMGEAPEGLSIERKDNNGNYCPENCIWATKLEQNNNMRSNRWLEHQGKRQTITQWAEELGMDFMTLSCRIDRLGWSVEKALTTPVKSRRTSQNR